MAVYVKKSGAWVEVAGGGNSSTDTNTTYTLGGGTSGTSDAYIRLIGSDGNNDDFTFVAGNNIEFTNASDSGFTIASTVGDVLVSQNDYTCTNPISVTESNGATTIGIGTTSNAHGKRYIQNAEPTIDVCDGDIWYDFDDGDLAPNSNTVDAEYKVARIWDQKSTGTDGGTLTQDQWNDRELNTKEDPHNIVSLNSTNDYFSLLPGTYKIKWRTPAFLVNNHISRIYYSGDVNFTSPQVEYGSNSYSVSSTNGMMDSVGEKIITITSTTYFKIQHRCITTNNDNGRGQAHNITNVNEVYTQVVVQDLSTTSVASSSGNGTALQYSTEQSASGTTVDFIGVPEWAKRITVLFDNVARVDTDSPEYLIQLGTSSGFINSNYSSSSSRHTLNNDNTVVTSALGFVIEGGTLSGNYSFYKHNNATYVGSGIHYNNVGSGQNTTSAGILSSVSGTINSIRITTTNGASFTGGTIQVIYEGEGSGGSESAPAGTIVAWGGSVASIPTGYILCDGSLLSRSNYAELFNAIGTVHDEGDGSSTFGIPNLVDRFVVGAHSDGASGVTFAASGGAVSGNYAPGNTGGSVAHALSVAELASHDHTFESSFTARKSQSGGTGYVPHDHSVPPNPVTNYVQDTITASIGSTGENNYHENRPPYYALAYIIKTGTTSSSLIPAGTVNWFASDTAPTGFVKANGAELLKTSYSDLYAEIGTTYGETDGNGGTGTSHFRVPDLRGEFIRGWDDGRGIDSGRSFASSQNSDNLAHSHSLYGYASQANATTYNINAYTKTTNLIGQVTLQGDGTNSIGGTESRPRNIALLACIKY